jgi:cytoskeletal protein CcmA (bactofilin family)
VVQDDLIEKMIRDMHKEAGMPTEEQVSVVSANATWEGTLRTEGSIKVAGKLNGEIEAGETVFVAAGARVQANVRARRVIVGGELEGQITCHDQLVVERSGRLGGKVTTATLVIEEGAIVQSQIEMLPAGAKLAGKS